MKYRVQKIEYNYNKIWHTIKANKNIVVNYNFTKLISREYFISLLRDYEFHLENICSINTKCGCLTY